MFNIIVDKNSYEFSILALHFLIAHAVLFVLVVHFLDVVVQVHEVLSVVLLHFVFHIPKNISN